MGNVSIEMAISVDDNRAVVELRGWAAAHGAESPGGRYSCSREAYDALMSVGVGRLVRRYESVVEGEHDYRASMRAFRKLPREAKAIVIGDIGGCPGCWVDVETGCVSDVLRY